MLSLDKPSEWLRSTMIHPEVVVLVLKFDVQ